LAIFQSFPHPVILLNGQNQVEMVNSAGALLLQGLGIAEEIQENRGLAEIPLPWLKEELAAFGQSQDEELCLEKEIPTSTGSRYFAVKLAKVPNRKKKSTVVFLTDWSERKIAEEALARSEQRYYSLVETARDIVVQVSAEGRITSVNSACESIAGWRPDELLGKYVSFILHPDDLPEAMEIFSTLLRGEIPPLKELRVLSKGGEYLTLEFTATPQIEDGKAFSFLGIVRNVTERKRQQEELRKAKEVAEAANRAKSEFLANMSHEIRTPMNGVIGMTNLLLDTALTGEQREYAEAVRNSAEDLLKIINDILDFSKIEAEKLTLEYLPFPLHECLGNIMKSLAFQAHRKGLELAYSVQPDVPEGLMGDSVRLRQILFNLVGNAIKFTDHGEVVVEIQKGEEIAAEGRVNLHFSVRDTGIGIPEEYQQKIFEAFSQVDHSPTRKHGGTGLGLAISATLVRMMGGKIWVEGKLGQGSIFHFTATFGVQEKGGEERFAPEKPAELRDLKALVVDDNETNRFILKEMLRRWQMRPTPVEGGRLAISEMERARDMGDPFRLVLLDAHMPDMDGFAVAERIKRNPSLAGATILMLTSENRAGDTARCRELGVSAYLIKPITPSDLWNAILTAMGMRASRIEPSRDTPVDSQGPRPLDILLVEDNPVNQKFIVRLLEKQGHKVLVAGNGKEALEMVEKRSFHLVFMDCQMPEMDGFEATAAIREREGILGRRTPIIAMTAYAMKGDQEKCIQAGMDDYLSKPVKKETLLAKIQKWTSNGQKG